MLHKIKEFLKNIKYKLSKESCYDEMVGHGCARLGQCDGLSGGDRLSDYLSYSCIGCPYLELK